MELDIHAGYMPNQGVVETRLSEEIVNNLWALINEAKEQPEDMNFNIKGNISSSLRLDGVSPLLEDFNQKVIPALIDEFIKEFGAPSRNAEPQQQVIDQYTNWKLDSLWVNFQNKHQFNPPHDHSGVYSFVIWMQIPTSYKEQSKLPIAGKDGFISDHSNECVSNFSFSYTDILGKTQQYIYKMEKEVEGLLVLFPSNLTHQVFPFYKSDDVRVSISGNLQTQ